MSSQVGAQSNRLADDKPIDVFAPAIGKSGDQRASKPKDERVFFRASDLADITVPDAAPLGAALIAGARGGPASTAPDVAQAVAPRKATGTAEWNSSAVLRSHAIGPDKLYVDLDALRPNELEPAPKMLAAPAPRKPVRPAPAAPAPRPQQGLAERVTASIDGLAARSESNPVPIGARPAARERTMLALGFLAPILVGLTAYGFFARWRSVPPSVIASAPTASAAVPSIDPAAPSAAVPMATAGESGSSKLTAPPETSVPPAAAAGPHDRRRITPAPRRVPSENDFPLYNDDDYASYGGRDSPKAGNPAFASSSETKGPVRGHSDALFRTLDTPQGSGATNASPIKTEALTGPMDARDAAVPGSGRGAPGFRLEY